MQPRGAILQDDLENGFRMVVKPLDPERNDGAAGRRPLVQLQFANRSQVAAVFVAVRPVQQQIFYGENLQPGQLGCPLRAHAIQRGHWPGKWGALLFGRCCHLSTTIQIEGRGFNGKPSYAVISRLGAADAQAGYFDSLFQRRLRRWRGLLNV